MGGSKAVAVRFSSGKEVLNAYWGFLANGGLVIRDQPGLQEGDAVSLEVTIESLQKKYRLTGQVVRRPSLEASAHEHAVIAFDPGEPHDLLLSAAWSDHDNVPARKHRRHPVSVDVRLRWRRGEERVLAGRLVNLSNGGCCIRIRSAPGEDGVGRGDEVSVIAGETEIAGLVRWVHAADFGVEFGASEASRVADLLRRYL